MRCFLFQDFVDAFEKLLRLGLKHQQEREIVHVTMDICTQEKQFNPYYAYLTQKFCEYHRRFQVRINFYVAKENKNAIFPWYFPSLNGNSAVEMNRTQGIHRIRFVEMDSKNSQQNFRSNFMIWPDVIKIVMYCLKSELPRKLNSLKLCACSPGHI